MKKIDYGTVGNSKNFTDKTLTRHILIDKSIMSEEIQKCLIKKINMRLNRLIQDINAYSRGRILPYIKVQRVIEQNEELRIVINELDSQTIHMDKNNLSLLINFRLPSAQRIITVCDELIKGDAKMIIDLESLESAAIDIFIDIAMFHSYSFLDIMTNEEKQEFNKNKYNFFIENNYNSFYYIDVDSPPRFLSFAFAARKGINEFNIIEYCNIWESFINNDFENQVHVNIPPNQQMEYHLQVGMIDKRYFTSELWDDYSQGDYLFLRINREPNTNERKEELAQYFGIPKFHCGATKIVPISEYYKPFFKTMLNEHYISAFKIVVD